MLTDYLKLHKADYAGSYTEKSVRRHEVIETSVNIIYCLFLF